MTGVLPRLALRLSGLCLVAALAGCGSEPASRGGLETPDAALPSDAQADVALPQLDTDRPPRPDTGQPDGADAQPGEGGESGTLCRSDADCREGTCEPVLAGSDRGICALPCTTDDDCRRTEECLLLQNSGGDLVRLCFPSALCIDADEDGFGLGPGCRGADCDDTDPGRFPGAPERCDGLDNNCDGTIDVDPIDAGRECDTGLAGVCARGLSACEGGVPTCTALQGPSPERCDGLDNDCDGEIDNRGPGQPLERACYSGPADTRGRGPCREGFERCEDGSWTSCANQVLPTSEICDGVDNNCDGETDEGLERSTFYPDRDGDTFGSAGVPGVQACRAPADHVANRLDCDDTDATVYPGATERPGDGIDQNCDGLELCFVDADGDGFRSPVSQVILSANLACDGPGEASLATPAGDCDDARSAVYPGAPERCDGFDNDCDGRTDEGVGCYANGQACEAAADCRSGVCDANLCVRATTCRDNRTCPDIITVSGGGGSGRSPQWILDAQVLPLTAPTPVLRSPRWQLVPGPLSGLARP
jgi:predicted small lipoprotein YifL